MNIKEQIGLVWRLQHFKPVQLVSQQMERKNTLLEIGIIRLFAKFTYFYFYLVLIITLKENVTINLNQF